MNCSTIGLARTATNGCSALSSSFLTATTVKSVNGSNASGMHTANGLINNSNKNNLLNANNLTNPSSTQKSNSSVSANKPPVAPSSATTMPMKSDDKTKRIDLAAKIIKASNIVCFDVDSTVIREEGIDELADFCGKGSEVARVTKEAMGGTMTFQDALKIRLNIIRPTQKQVADFIKQRPSTLTRNIKRFVEHLKTEGKQIYLISGGFDSLIEPVANELGIPISNLFANKLMFFYNGEYANFDTTQPTSKSGGKAEAISIIKRQNPNALITMIGDGATDLEAVPPANHFIGFGGNVIRDEVQYRAQYYVTDFEQLM